MRYSIFNWQGGTEMVFTIRRVPAEKQRLLNVQEVFSLWDLLKTKYSGLDHLIIFINFIHDFDFKQVIQKRLEESRKEIKFLEELIAQYRIPAPKPVRKEVKSAINTEIFTDEYLFSILLLFEQELVEMALRAFRSAVTNDYIRKVFKGFVHKQVDWLDFAIKYAKLKGWLDQPALYPNIPVSSNEQIDCGTAYQLWDHLTFRYANIEITEIYRTVAMDGDFKLLLKKGIQDVLKKEAARLEKELVKFGLPLPPQPKTIYEDLGMLQIPDQTMFKQLFIGMQSAAIVHAQALKQCTTNDRIRQLFNELLKSEVNLIDGVIKYGKAKGWLEEAPRYSPIK
jgi:hypothetical protein